MHSLHGYPICNIIIIIISSVLPFGAQTPRHALRPEPTKLLFECHQVIRFVVSPCCSLTHQERMQQQPRHVTRRLYFIFSVAYRTVPCRRLVSSQLCVLGLPQHGRGTYTTRALTVLSFLQGGKIRGPVSALWGDVSGTLFPAGQIRIGSPMTAAGLSCSVGHAALVSKPRNQYLRCMSVSAATLILLFTLLPCVHA